MKEITPETYPIVRDILAEHLAKAFPNIKCEIPKEMEQPEFEDFRFIIGIARPDNFVIQDYIWSKSFFKFEGKLREEYPSFSVRIKEIPPKLVQAELGQFVLSYSETFPQTDDESSVGIVASVWKNGKKNVYGVRYIEFPAASSLANNSLENIELTEEDYGGYHTGFLKVLTREEATERLQKKLTTEFKQAKTKLKNDEKYANEDLLKLIEMLTTKSVAVKVQNLQIEDDGYSSSVPYDMRISRRFNE